MVHGIDLKRLSTPGNPASTHDRLYNDANGTLYFRDSNGVQNQVSPASGSFTSFTMSDGSNNQTINSGNTQTFTGGIAINGTVSATDTLTLNWNLTKLSSANGTLKNVDYLGFYSLSSIAHQRVALSDLPVMPSIDTTNDRLLVLKNSDGLLKLAAPSLLGGGSAPFDDATAIVKGSADATKLVRFEVDGLTPATTRVLTVQDANYTLIGRDTTDTLTNKTLDADGTGNVIANIGSSEVKAELITGQSADTAPDVGADYLLSYDASAAGLKKILMSKLFQYAILRDEKSTGTNGGGSTASTWNNRNLNTEVVDADSIVSISSNQFTPIAGTYRLRANAPALQVNAHRLRLYNVTGAASVDEGPGISAAAADAGMTTALLTVSFTANGTDAYRIDHYTSATKATNGLGAAIGDGSAEVYLEILLVKVA